MKLLLSLTPPLKKKKQFLVFHFLTTARSVYFLICWALPKNQSDPFTFPGCKYVIDQRPNNVPRGWTRFPGCAKHTGV